MVEEQCNSFELAIGGVVITGTTGQRETEVGDGNCSSRFNCIYGSSRLRLLQRTRQGSGRIR